MTEETESQATPPEHLNYDALAREGAEPEETPRGLPLLMAVLLGATGAWGATYFWYEAGDGSDYLLGDHRYELLAAERAPDSTEEAETAPSPDGRQVFTSICASCHQSNGRGVPGAFPPLAGSSWVVGAPERPIAIVLRGLSGEIEVLGRTYDAVMPAFGDQLSDPEIAAVITYVRSAWGNEAGPVDVELVRELRERHGGGGMIPGSAGLDDLGS